MVMVILAVIMVMIDLVLLFSLHLSVYRNELPKVLHQMRLQSQLVFLLPH